ncbi:uncharacterized protein L199_004059 [Kwoniella botswanensis]|uniref:uncharacterized protein n=1 Tax=Kwoniella botswanensis TaxID=1268659 RepID=UPI00315CE689
MSTSSTTLTSGWYTNAYSGPFRSGRLRAPSLLPGSRRPVVTTIPVQQTLVVDLNHNHTHNHNGNNGAGEDNKNVRRRETIFGPDVGEDDEPGWTENKNQEIGVEKVKEWVERSKNEEGLHATTTLQALVNLKRPTLLLHQIENAIEEGRSSLDKAPEEDITVAAVTSSPTRNSISGANSSQGHFKRDSVQTQIINAPPLHTLSFKYDATTPLVRVQLEIYPTPRTPATHVDGEGVVEGKESIVEDHDNEPKIIYSGLHQGGFNQSFTLPHTSALDLSDAIIPIEEQQQQQTDAAAAATVAHNQAQNVPVPEPVTTPPGEDSTSGSRWRRGLFRRNREQDLEAATGIEMTNRLDANGQPIAANGETQGEGDNANEKKKTVEKGMRLLIRIDGVGPEGEPLPRKNAQLTHILISGTWVTDNNASTTNTTQPPEQGQLPGKRVWVVKVARREAVIGSHTFLLKEIYGLSSTSTSSTSNTQYPPTQDDPYASTPNECIVCLTSPRDVVLLPCRHLVVCRDCAVGMVEYGAGGKVGRREDAENNTGADATPTGNGNGAGAGGSGSGNNTTAQVAGGTTTQGRERRKKKVKGWYCPVCRQPYTSLLRLALPESSAVDSPAENELARVPSRAASVRTTRTARSVLAPSIAPTLPDGAERMLDALRPDDVRARDNDDEDDDDDENVNRQVEETERPQFVLGNEEDKAETEHKEDINDFTRSTADPKTFDLGQPVSSTTDGDGSRRSQDGKGWKEV